MAKTSDFHRETLSPHHPKAWTRAQCQAFDSHLQHLGMPAVVLMELAAKGAQDLLLEGLAALDLQPEAWQCLVLAGPGNNGADGVALARQLLGHPKFQPVVWLLRQPEADESLLAHQCRVYQQLGGQIWVGEQALEHGFPASLVVVDALFGVGLDRPIVGPYQKALENPHFAKVPVLAIDQPSGLDADTGAILGTALPAHWTACFAAPRIGFTSGEGPRLCGEVRVIDLGVQPAVAAAWARDTS
jgi:hydroxyethylthiazole kinase-like uncharacterized protein yjeF